jgi:hypothetical protein
LRATKASERAFENRYTSGEIISIDVDGVDLVLKKVGATAVRTFEECEVLIAEVLTAASKHLRVVDCCLWNEVAHTPVPSA